MNKFVTLMVLVSCSSLLAELPNLTFSKLDHGSQYQFTNARTLGMGGTGVAGAAAVHGTMLNPALIALTAKQVEVSVLGSIYNLEEDRSYPYYDNFGGFVDYGSYVYNSNTYADFGFSAIISLPFLESYKLTAGVSANPLLDFDYSYLEEVRSNAFGDALLAYNKIKSEGVLREYAVTLGAEVLEQVSMGIKIGVVDGGIDRRIEIVPKDESLENIYTLESSEIKLKNMPVNINAGMHYQYNENFAAGVVVRFPLTIETDVNVTTQMGDVSESVELSNKVKYPLSLVTGIDYRFTNILEARLNFDFEYTFWSEMKDDFQKGLDYSDTYAFKVGVEHIFFDKMPFRVGFSYQPLKENRQYTRTVLTAGVGILFENFVVDLAGGLEGFNTNQKDLFDDGLYPPLVSRANDIDRVQANFLYGILEIRFGLDSVF